MKPLYINISNKIATYQKRCGSIVCGNRGYRIIFTFDAEWANYDEKVARFIWNNEHLDMPFTGNTCDVPPIEIADVLTVGVYVADICTTTAAKIPCILSIKSADTAKNTQAEREQVAYNSGRKAEYDAFWDAYQDASAVDCGSRFSGRGWNDRTFKPKYNIPNNAPYISSFNRLFANCGITDLAQILNDCGVKLDFTQVTRTDQMFYWATWLTRVPELDLRNVTMTNSMFSTAISLVTIEKLIVSANTPFDNAFFDCQALENIVIEGELAYPNISFAQSAKLSKDSMKSIIDALSDKVSGNYTLTLSTDAVYKEFPHPKYPGAELSDEWYDLVATKPNWTISLAQFE